MDSPAPNSRKPRPKKNDSTSAYQAAPWEKIVATSVGVAVFALLVFIVLRNEKFADPNIVLFVRIMLAFAVAVLGAIIPGVLHVGWTGTGDLAIRAGGALALFIVAFFGTPAVLATKADEVPAAPIASAEKPAVKPIEFQQIEIDEKISQWTPVERPYEIGSPIMKSTDEHAKPIIGVPRSACPMGTNQIPDFALKDDVKGNRVIDPIFSIVLANVSDKPMTLTGIGVRPLAAWDAIKAAPCVVKLHRFEAITISMTGFDPAKPQMHRFDAPISIGAHGSYRIKLRLADYNRAVGRNESVIQLVAELNQETFASPEIYLGLCFIPE